MSSPPALDFPTSDDVQMDDDTGQQTVPDAVSQQNPLFLAGTPSAAGTPRTRRGQSGVPDSTPLRGAVARRALAATQTPKRTPLFNRTSTALCLDDHELTRFDSWGQFITDAFS